MTDHSAPAGDAVDAVVAAARSTVEYLERTHQAIAGDDGDECCWCDTRWPCIHSRQAAALRQAIDGYTAADEREGQV